MASKPSRLLDWISDDSASKYTTPSGAQQLAGHQDATNADAKVFNWAWWRCSQWIEFLDNTFDANGKDINAPKSTTITETIAPIASCVTLDAGGIKSWDGLSNAIFSVTEAGAVSLGYSGNDVISLTAGVISVCTATSADLVKLHAITASYTELNQLTGVTVGGSSAGDIATINGTQTLTNKSLTSPNINEAVNLTSTSTELNQLDGVTVGGSSPGDIVTINATQTLTNKSISFSQITAGTAPAGRTYVLTGNDSTPSNISFQGTTRYTRVSCDTAGTTFTILPSATGTVNYYIGNSSYRPTTLNLYAGSGGSILNTGSGGVDIDTTGAFTMDGASFAISVTGLGTISAGDDSYVTITGGNDSVGNNYGAVWINYGDLGYNLFKSRVGSNTELYYMEYNSFRPGSNGATTLGGNSNRWSTIYGTNLNITATSGDAIVINNSGSDGLQVSDWAASSGGIHISVPTLNTTRGQIALDATSTAIATKYSNASGGELATYNNGGTIELWWHDGSSWAKIA